MSQLKSIQDEDPPIWLPRLAVRGGPRFLQIADALQAAVMDCRRSASWRHSWTST
jgi:hypothetical protein